MSGSPNVNTSGQFLPPPQRGPQESSYDFNFRYILWLRTGGAQTILGPGGTAGLAAVEAIANAASAEATAALALAEAGILLGDEAVAKPAQSSQQDLVGILIGDDEMLRHRFVVPRMIRGAL